MQFSGWLASFFSKTNAAQTRPTSKALALEKNVITSLRLSHFFIYLGKALKKKMFFEKNRCIMFWKASSKK
jgi:hypothetical protein